ncbi:hypothetical protein [Ohtaekwangia koreensis]|uniref:hypothetical protein n=1 Tax=Ohtaekwangia koreensis TaxID=688867 RepID=UPI0013563A8E|nr:hypothetical protein [Ohtaekwangia koreensis]
MAKREESNDKIVVKTTLREEKIKAKCCLHIEAMQTSQNTVYIVAPASCCLKPRL